MKRLTKHAAWIAGALAVAGVLAGLLPQGRVRGFDVSAFGRLPVLEGGRVKPVDSVARNTLLVIRSQQTFAYEEAGGKRSVSAGEWLLDVLFRPQVADKQPVFVINDPDVLGIIGERQSSNRYFSFERLGPHIAEIQKQAQIAHGIDPKQRDRFQSAIANLFERLYLYYRLRNTAQIDGVPGGLGAMIASRQSPGAEVAFQEQAQTAYFRILPPPAGASPEAWRSSGEALLAARSGPLDPALESLARAGVAWSAQDPASFDRAVAELASAVTSARPEALSQAGHELLFNRAQPFYAGMVIYVLALLALFASWAWKPELLQRVAFGFLAAGAVVHTLGLASRVVLQGRPPVTNLYSSAVFVGWGAVLLGVVLERMYKRGFATAVAAASGFASLLVAHHLSGDGDTMEMMRAVLDSNFWLATHVITITIGYSGTFLAGALAIAWALRRHVLKKPDGEGSKSLVAMAYGIICFSLFFSFVGTVLGGIWADQSWGRFWGWDPKENGALLIVLWNAIILHARWGGFARDRGVMTMAIFGNVITSLSWFGVNMLGVGLHSYGFMDKAFWALAGFIGSQLLLMAVAYAPPRFWARASQAKAKASKDAPEPA